MHAPDPTQPDDRDPGGREGDPPDDLDPEEAVRIPIEDHIDLHPFRPREIADVVASYLEEARAAGFRTVRIVHGRGTGTQREIVRKVLERTPFVDSFRDAPPPSGWGATVVELGAPPEGGQAPSD